LFQPETGIVTIAVNTHGQGLKRGAIHQTTFVICAANPQAGIVLLRRPLMSL
jgi:hypothetical protein